jgi:hypothetical protein
MGAGAGVREMPDLYEAINQIVEKRLRQAFETGEIINVLDLASQMTESLADLMICCAAPEEQPRLVAHVLTVLNRFLLDKRKAGLGAQSQYRVIKDRKPT